MDGDRMFLLRLSFRIESPRVLMYHFLLLSFSSKFFLFAEVVEW